MKEILFAIGKTIQACFGVLYLYRHFIAVGIILVGIIVFLIGRKKHGRLFTGLTLCIVGISVILVALGCYNVFLCPSYQKQPVTQQQLELLCSKLADGTYDPYHWLPNDSDLSYKRNDTHTPNFEFQKRTLDVIGVQKGISHATGFITSLGITILECNTVDQAIAEYDRRQQSYWKHQQDDKTEILQKGYLEIDTPEYRAYVTPVEFSADIFNWRKGDCVRKFYSVTIQYDSMLVAMDERTDMGGVALVLPDLIMQDCMFDPNFSIQ